MEFTQHVNSSNASGSGASGAGGSGAGGSGAGGSGANGSGADGSGANGSGANGSGAGTFANETNYRLSLICGLFLELCNNPELQLLMRNYQSILHRYIDNRNILDEIKCETNKLCRNPITLSQKIDRIKRNFNKKIDPLKETISNKIEEISQIYRQPLLPTHSGTGAFGSLFLKENNNTKIIKKIKTNGHNKIPFINTFNEFIIQKLLSLEIEEVNHTINSTLKMNIPKIYQYTKKNNNIMMEMNYIPNHKSLSDYILKYPITLPIDNLFFNLNNLITNYIQYLRILQDKFSFIHFDMNLANILLNVDEDHNITQFHLIDFGESYIKINEYHFFGNISYYNTNSLVKGTQDRNYWKSYDIIYLLLNICGALFHKYNCIDRIGGTGFGNRVQYILNIDKIKSNIELYNFIKRYFHIGTIGNEEIYNQLLQKIFYIQINKTIIPHDSRLPSNGQVHESFFKMIILNYEYVLDLLLHLGGPIRNPNSTLPTQEYEVTYIFNLYNHYKIVR